MAYELTEEIRVSVDGGCTVTTFAAGEHEDLPKAAIAYAEANKVLKAGSNKATSAPKNKAEPAPAPKAK